MDSDRGIIGGWPRALVPKTFLLADGRIVLAPRDEGAPPALNAEPLYRGAGSPLEPTGTPLSAGVGPGSWVQRPDVPDLDHHGEPKIVPLAMAPGCGVSEHDPDPRGMSLFDAHGERAGTVRELWIDRGELMFRYLEAEVQTGDGGTRRVLVPVPFARITAKGVTVHALLAEQFGGVPGVRGSDRITLLEEEKITAYYGAGTLYAEPHRAEPLV